MMFSRRTMEAPRLVAVGGVEQHLVTAPVPWRSRIEDPDLVVDELDVGQVRVQLADRVAQRPVEGVHRPVALRGADVARPSTQILIVASVSTRPSARFSVITRKLLEPEQGLVLTPPHGAATTRTRRPPPRSDSRGARAP